MRHVDSIRGKRVTVMGLGHFGGGIAVARWLVSQSSKVIATDLQPADKLADSLKQLDGLDIQLKLGGHELADFTQTDLVVVSPAVPPTNEFLLAARDAGVPITTEIALVVERLPTHVTLGVTGTKGKSTTATLLAKMLGGRSVLPPERAQRLRAIRSDQIDLSDKRPRNVWLGGNLGGSLLQDLPQITDRDFVVLELSSYMLHYLGEMQWSPHIALVTMVGADHLAWHGDVESYLEAKRNIVRFQGPHDFAVLPTFSKDARAFKEHTGAQVIEYGKRAHLPEAFAPQLLGKHNRYNERGAYAAAALMGVYPDQAAFEVMDFTGLPHRLDLVWEDERGVRWVNDSIATIPEAAIVACEAFPAGSVLQIVGGSDKGLPLETMVATLRHRCKAVLCIGEIGPRIAALVGEKATNCGALHTAVKHASALATEGDVILLSPGTASYDQFPNFQLRGEAFTNLAKEQSVKE